VFNSLKLSVVAAVEVLVDVLVDILADIAADIVVDVADRTELEAWVEIQQLEELEVLLIAIYY
jgi:hypothetical protein